MTLQGTYLLINVPTLHSVFDCNISAFTEIQQMLPVMGTALFWVIKQRVVVISYRRFRTTYRSHLQGSRILGFC